MICHYNKETKPLLGWDSDIEYKNVFDKINGKTNKKQIYFYMAGYILNIYEYVMKKASTYVQKMDWFGFV